MPTALLDPTLDVVFQVLLARNQHLLVKLLTAVLRPSSPIALATVLNPGLPKAEVDDRGAVLDVRVRLEDGREVNVEMQRNGRPAQRERALYYWARQYSALLVQGDDFEALVPCVAIWILGYRELPGARFHRTFRVHDVRDQTLFSDALELHTVELPKLPGAGDEGEEASLVRWGRFFATRSDAELEGLAMSDPDLRQAKEALERLSLDAEVRELARRREIALDLARISEAAARKEGKAEGRAEGKAEGKAEAVLDLLADAGVAVSEEHRARIMGCKDAETLRRWLRRARSARAIEELFEP